MKFGKEYWCINKNGEKCRHIWVGSILDCQRYLEGNIFSMVTNLSLVNGEYFDNIYLMIRRLPHFSSGLSFASKSLLFPNEDYIVCGDKDLTAIQQVNNYLFKEVDEIMEDWNKQVGKEE